MASRISRPCDDTDDSFSCHHPVINLLTNQCYARLLAEFRTNVASRRRIRSLFQQICSLPLEEASQGNKRINTRNLEVIVAPVRVVTY